MCGLMNVVATFVYDCMTQAQWIRIQCMSFQELFKYLSLNGCLGGLFLSASEFEILHLISGCQCESNV